MPHPLTAACAALVLLGLVGCSDRTAPAGPKPVRPVATTAASDAAADEPSVLTALIDDFEIEKQVVRALTSPASPVKSLAPEQLAEQLKRTRCPARLASRCRTTLSPADLYASRRQSVVAIVGAPEKCDTCPEWHLSSAAGGFLITADGLCVTNWHVVGESETALYAVTAAGAVYGIEEVAAASEADDVAIVKLAGTGFEPVALATAAPVGSRIFVISHPSGRYYTFTEGIVSRQSMEPRYQKPLPAEESPPAAPPPAKVGEKPAPRPAPKPTSPELPSRPMITVTADFGAGSSGGPVFDACGNVVGMVAETETFYGDVDAEKDPQMVLKLCVPASSILALLER